MLLGDYEAHRAEQALRSPLDASTGKDDHFIRFALAKSLARLGKADVLPVLITDISDDDCMSRHVGDLGLEALGGKSPDDFEGDAYAEGGCAIGGLEDSMPLDALTKVEREAGRCKAATAYPKWPKAERPDLHGSMDYRPEPRRTAAAR